MRLGPYARRREVASAVDNPVGVLRNAESAASDGSWWISTDRHASNREPRSRYPVLDGRRYSM
jgi:hypothetical protein